MFDEILEKFEGSPSQQAVIRLFLARLLRQRGGTGRLRRDRDPLHRDRARELDVDRRVVDSTTDAILADPELKRIFTNISSVPSLMDLAPVLDLTVLTIEVAAAGEAGIVAEVTGILADHGISIRQVLSEDPEFTDDPKLYVITDTDLSGDLLVEIRDLEYVRRVGF